MQGSTRRMGVMTDVHRRFLQLLMTHGVLEEWDVKRLQRHCYKVHDRMSFISLTSEKEKQRSFLARLRIGC
ncbi:NSMCE1 isoform 6 [Pan troglodytes]|uniref:NSMCE1 isoform 2 n=4 Tax=Homininae TaxID=207598 RepID=A0A6D2WJ63_PANTR|nr:NSMCE1 isoform 2 [Pan troglodytes]PNI23934.1 NSMCE1 isoform 6 [Pan troglodytes]